ncbi:Bug family tripartite tricarboxylate transporter substrate binding protein [Bordetella genomosp. 12]|uniref:ABC transporter substrate-binding protein n=1 Tax=Bordetella genomosp. 12 TaxID=463035 RepID=A0A261VKY8_9BORD|nr:tripartite tricarboxylate transporter substrate binding protein [Bordetella genomosp. 12]OZI74804.1 ABC transporter substrate-binding protein [Bordetella genomosp. 12]
MTRRWTFALACAASLLTCASHAAQDYPNHPVSIVVPVAAGGAMDIAGRALAQHLKDVLGQPVIVENKPGGSGNIAYGHVARAKPDGYTLLFSYEGFHAGNPALTQNLPWDPIKSFTPIAEVTRGPHVITVPKSSPAKDLREFIALAQKPDANLNYASSGTGSIQHLGTEQFKLLTKAHMTHVPYNGAAPAMQDLLANRVQLLITTPPTVIGQIQAGQLRGLAITSARRHPMLPDVPTTAEAGLPDFQLEAWFSLFGPANMPPDVVQKLSKAMQTVVTSPAFQEQITKQGSYASYQPPEVVGATLKKDLAHWADVVKQAGLTAN